MTAALRPDPDGRPQDDVVTVPRAEYRRLRALRRLASPRALDDADAAAAAAAEEFQDWVAAGRPGAITQAQARQLNRLDWYSAHGWAVPYPGDTRILAPDQVPGHNLPAGYLGD
jgi:hypothetical protein